MSDDWFMQELAEAMTSAQEFRRAAVQHSQKSLPAGD